MARDPLGSAVCAVCGTKFNPERDRCPRCRTKIERLAPEAVEAAARVTAERSRRMQIAGASALVIALAGVAGVWLVAPTDQPGTVAPTSIDPLSARRPPVAAPPDTGAPTGPRERVFMDATASAKDAYDSGDPETALRHYQDAVSKNPRDAESLSNLGQMLVRLNRADESIAYFNRAIELNSDRWAFVFNRARAYGLLSRWTESIADYRRAQQLFPTDYATAFNLAMTLHKAGDEDAAVAEYQKAIDLAPDDPQFRIALGISLERLNRKAEAAAAYGEALKLNPSAPDADKVKERIAMLTALPAPAGTGRS